MPIVKMQKVALLSHKSIQEELLEFLQDEGVMEVSPNEETTDIDHPKVAYEAAEIKFAIDFLMPVATKETKKMLKNPGTPKEITYSALHTDFRDIVNECKKLEDAAGELASEKQELLAQHKKLDEWSTLPVKLNERETQTSIVSFGTCAASVFENLQAEVEKGVSNIALQLVDTVGGQALISATIWKNDREKFEQTAAKFGWTEAQLPIVERTPTQELKRIDQDLRLVGAKEEELKQKRMKLSELLPDLSRLAQYLNWMDMKQAVRSEFAQTDQTVMLTGWIAKNKFRELEEKLAACRLPLAAHKTLSAVALIPIEPRADEDPPMQIKNRNWIAPFEAVTRLYGLPQGSEMDPTRPLMPFFILYFGLCLTDAGYGFVLAAVMGAAILKFGLKRQEQKLIWLLFYAGIVTFIVSIPFGGWFGVTPDQAPAWMTKVIAGDVIRFKGQVWDLNKDVDFFRNLAISLGVFQVLFGIFLAGYWKFIHGKKFEAFASHFTVHIFVALLVAQYLTHLTYLTYPTYIIAALFIWGNGKGPWFVRPLVGVLGTLGALIGIMSNVLSYLRILALGLATGALAFAINQVALVMKDLLPVFIGIPIFIAILLFGHMISLVLNGLGSFVHSGRLQFIEFFGQFFQGGGREFAPFRRSINSIS